ncbi:MAG: hypothetical protein AAB846_00560 [Patescibacteria group bacterium]
MAVLASLLLASEVFASSISGETEFGAQGNGERLFSQYLFYDTEKVNFTARYFWVDQILERGEFSTGPTFSLGNSATVKLWAGGTTDEEVMLGGSLFARPFGHELLYIIDPKLSTNKHMDGIYQKLIMALDQKNIFHFRIESLQLSGTAVFVRAGIETRLNLPWGHLYIHPYFDPVRIEGKHIFSEKSRTARMHKTPSGLLLASHASRRALYETPLYAQGAS